MPEISFNLADLFEQTFGYKTKAFDPAFSYSTNGVIPRSRIEFGAQGSEYYVDDALGREYFMPVKVTYIDESGTADSSQNDFGITTAAAPVSARKEIYLPYPVISISSRKTIIETHLTERRGTVKELINVQDYEIVIKGLIISETTDFPEAEVTALRSLYEQNIALSIQCPLTDIFLLRPDRSGSDQVVIREMKFPAITGVKNVRPYELHLVSDEPFNLITI